MAAKKLIEEKYIDPVFAKVGKRVYTYEYVEKLRKENLQLKKDGKPIFNLIPQKGFQEKVLLTQADIKIVGGKRGGGKVLPNDTQIVTPFGMRLNGDLKIGQTISNPVTGGFEKVIAIYEHPDHEFYEMMFDDGSTVECGLEHLWKVRQTGYTHKRRHMYGGEVEDDYRIWTFGMIKEWLDKQTNEGMYMDRGSKKYLVIPLCEPVKFTKSGASMKKTDIDPYIIGALIGDGNISSSQSYDAALISADEDIVREFEIRHEPYEDGLYVMDSVESTASLLYHAVHAGATVFNCYSVENSMALCGQALTHSWQNMQAPRSYSYLTNTFFFLPVSS